ncbi:MAG: acyltransferase [Pirellulaceae bacterium]|nr:acyltransferase [Pirellulaceae bacterium]
MSNALTVCPVSDPPKVKAKTKRIVELDSLRAIAALNLVLFHFTHVYTVKYGYTTPLGFDFPFGKYGVQLFFMLSGFVNAMTLLRKRKSADFLAARIMRICPTYWSVIVINLLIVGIAPLTLVSYSPEQVAANLSIMPNLFGYECMEPVTWTLQVEVLFYCMILVMFMTGALETPFRTVMWLLALSLVTCSSINFLAERSHDPMLLGWMTLCRDVMILEYLPLFLVGVLLNEIRCERGKLSLNVIGIFSSLFVFHYVDRLNHNPVASLILFVLLAASAYGRVPLLRCRPLVFVSTISYALYLLHNNLGCVFIYHVNHAGVPPLLSMLAGIVFVIAVSTFVTYKIEGPVTAWLRRRWVGLKENIASRRETVPASTT